MRIFDFALVSDWESRVHDLAAMVEPERWDYLYANSEFPLPILDSYLRHTFARLSEEGKVQLTDELACFNTGLLTPSQEEVYGIFNVAARFDPQQPATPRNKKWFLKAWVRAGDRIMTQFEKFPELASYWRDPGQLIFDPSLRVELNLDHIIRDNLQRFPIELGGNLGEDGIPGEVEASAEEDDRGNHDPSSNTEVKVPIKLRNALDGAMKQSIRLAQRSYRIAVPQFHRGNIQLLLPLYMRETGRADLALTLERHGGWYRAATILYPDWAYRHARLLARPNSEWLGGFPSELDASKI